MLDGYENDKYYVVREVAEIKGISKQAVIDACKKGKYPGAIKTTPTKVNRQGIWLIPKNVIDNPVVTQDVAVINHKITSQELQYAFREAIKEEVEPLKAEIKILRDELNAHFRRQDEKITLAAGRTQDTPGFFARLFGRK